MSGYSWRGTKVKHEDGREGSIVSDYEGFLHRVLTIDVVGGGESFVQLNSNGPDTGEAGWSWWCEEFSEGARWLKLGDHAEVDSQSPDSIARNCG